MFGQVHETARVCDESGPDQLSHQNGEVGRDGDHPVLEVLVQLGPVLLNITDGFFRVGNTLDAIGRSE